MSGSVIPVDLAAERARRGLPDYARPEPAPQSRPEGRRGHLSRAQREALHSLIRRMVTTAPATTNREIAAAYEAASGLRLSGATIRQHRRRLGLPSAPEGYQRRTHRRTAA